MSRYDDWRCGLIGDDGSHPGSPNYEPDEALDELVAELIDERMADPVKVAGEIDELAGTSDMNDDGNTHFAADLAAVLDASNAAFEAEAIRYFAKLRIRVRDSLTRDAGTDAEAIISERRRPMP